MAKKVYAVKKGACPGIYHSWTACKAQVDGFPGAEYKGFQTLAEAEQYLRGTQCMAAPRQKNAQGTAFGAEDPVAGERQLPMQRNCAEADMAIAYVDGSYNPAVHEFSCGAVLFYQGEKKLFSQKYNDPQLADMRNVAGEIMGAVSVISYCLEKKIPALEIYHDYAGVSKWALGEWKTNKEGTKAYAAFCRAAAEKLKISFVKVKGHSGDKYNDEADLLAKQALGLG